MKKINLKNDFKKYLQGRVLSYEQRFHVQVCLLLFFVSLFSLVVSLCSLALNTIEIAIIMGAICGYSLIIFFCDLKFKKLDKYIQYIIEIPIAIAITFYFIYTPNKPLFTYWMVFIPFLFLVTIGVKKSYIFSLYIFLLSIVCFFTPLKAYLPFGYGKQDESELLSYKFIFELTILSTSIIGIFVSAFYDIAIKRLQHLEEKYHKAALEDKLTGISNQVALSQYIKNINNNFTKDDYICVFFIDIDNFKKINDNYGHLCGNELLISLSSVLKNKNYNFACRWGGDEFMVIEKNLTDEKMESIANDIIKDVSELRLNGYPDMTITVSIGVAKMKNDENFDFDSLLTETDKLLINSKKSGKNTYTLNV